MLPVIQSRANPVIVVSAIELNSSSLCAQTKFSHERRIGTHNAGFRIVKISAPSLSHPPFARTRRPSRTSKSDVLSSRLPTLSGGTLVLSFAQTSQLLLFSVSKPARLCPR